MTQNLTATYRPRFLTILLVLLTFVLTVFITLMLFLAVGGSRSRANADCTINGQDDGTIIADCDSGDTYSAHGEDDGTIYIEQGYEGDVEVGGDD